MAALKFIVNIYKNIQIFLKFYKYSMAVGEAIEAHYTPTSELVPCLGGIKKNENRKSKI